MSNSGDTAKEFRRQFIILKNLPEKQEKLKKKKAL